MTFASRAHFKVNPSTGHFVDEFGRSRFFHGVNAVYKIPPWHPKTEGFDHANSLSSIDAQNLFEWGFNHVRLGVMWPGVQPTSSKVDLDYLATMGQIVDTLAQFNISTLVDCHQDLISRKFCGEGAPEWLVPTSHGLPFANPSAPRLPLDDEGMPVLKECLKRPFFHYYFSDKVGIAFQELYNSTSLMQQKFVEFWTSVAKALSKHDGVMGYELINEPWPGDIYKDPRRLIPGFADKQSLVPLYERLHKAIRAVDDERLLFFEPAVTDLWTSGFQQGPGGPSYNDRQVYSYHIYCGINDNKTDHDRRTTIVCRGEDSIEWTAKMKDIKRIGAGAFLTEFGASAETKTAIKELEYMTGRADARLQSWDYWQFKYFEDITTANHLESFYREDGTLEEAKVRALSRTYAPAIAGVPTKMEFVPATSAFTLQYKANANARLPTEIYLNEKYYYPKGFTVAITPASAAAWVQTAPNRVEIRHSASITPDFPITVTISKV